MNKKLSMKRGGILFGAGGLGGLLAMLCCLPLIFGGLLAAVGLNFLMPNNLLLIVITLGGTFLFAVWWRQKRGGVK